MIILTTDEIIDLQEKLILATGGSAGLRDLGLLQSAFFSAIQFFDDEDLYKTIEEKSARLAFAITKNHPFVDGNKRIGIFVMLMTLKLNNVKIKYEQKELVSLGLGIADGSIEYSDILIWINGHRIYEAG